MTSGKALIPQTWLATALDAITEIRLGRQCSPDRVAGDCLRPYLRSANVTWAGLDLADVKRMRFEPRELSAYVLRKGDILLGEASGSPMEVGKPAVWNDEITGCCFQNTLIRVRPPGELSPFLYYVFLHDARRGAFARASKGIGIHHLGAETLARWPVVLPPLSEQRRIVARIEALAAHSRRAKAALTSISPLLGRFRRSVLAAAFRGDLTADWRSKNPDVEAAEQLLGRIQAERRRRWEQAELARMQAKGDVPGDDRWKAKYPQAAGVDASKLPVLPSGWAWASVESLCAKVVDGVHKKPDYVKSGIPFLTVKNLTAASGIDFESVNCISERDHCEFIKRADPEPGDLLVSKDGTLGVVRLVRTSRAFSIFVSLALAKPVMRQMGEFLELALSCPQVQARMTGTGSGLPHIQLRDLRAYAIPVAPLAEQQVLVERAQAYFRRISALQGLQESGVEQVAALDRSILAKAFRGELVPQDPNDETAAALLQRIRVEREGTGQGRGRQRRGPKGLSRARRK